jgi:hypothetical protein
MRLVHHSSSWPLLIERMDNFTFVLPFDVAFITQYIMNTSLLIIKFAFIWYSSYYKRGSDDQFI